MAAFTEEKFFTRSTQYNKDWRISILQDGGPGAGTRITAKDFMFRKRFPFSDDRDFWNQKIIEPILEVRIRFDPSSDITFYRNIVENPDDTYRLQFKYDGSLDVFGSIRGDLVTISEAQAATTVTLRAKPLAVQRGTKFPLKGSASYVEIAPLIGDIVNLTSTDLNIYTYNDWTDPAGGGSDYFGVAALDEYHLRDYAGSKSTDTQITYYDALEEIIPEGYIFTLFDGAWRLISVPYIANQQGTSVTEYEYTFGGTVYALNATNTVSLRETLDSQNHLLTRESQSKHYSGYKTISQDFNHKTLISSISFDASYVHSAIGDSPATETQDDFEADGNQRIKMTGTVTVKTDDTAGNFKTGNANLLLQAHDREYDLVNDSWPTAGSEIDITLAGTGQYLSASFSFTTAVIPSDADGTLTVELRWASDDGNNFSWVTQEVEWSNVTLDIINGDVASDNASIIYELEQSQQYAAQLDLPSRIFGEGPTAYSRSAIRYLSGGNYQQLTSWSHVGDGSSVSYAELLMGDIMDAQRSGTRVIVAKLWTEHSVGDVITYNSNYYLFLGGTFDGSVNQWTTAYLYKLDHNTGSDTFTEIYDTGGQPASGSGGSSTGTSGGGLTESDADNLYLKLDGSNDPMTGALDMGGNNISNVARLLATEVEIDGDWQLRSQTPGSVNRLFIDPITADSNVEIFVAPSGTATSAALTLADGPNQTNYEGIEIAADEVTNRITSLTEGTGTIRELQLRVDGDEDLSLWRDSTKYIDLVSGGVTISQALTAQGGIEARQTNHQIAIVDTDNSKKWTIGTLSNNSDLGIFVDGVTSRLNILSGGGVKVPNTITAEPGYNSTSLSIGGAIRKLSLSNESNLGSDGALHKYSIASSAGRHVFGNSASTLLDLRSTGNIDVPSGFLAVNKTSPTEALDVNGNILTSGTLTAQTALTVNTTSLTSGFIADFNGDVLVRDDLQINGGLIAEEFIIEQFRSVPTFQMSPAHGRVAAVSGTAGDETITLEDPRGNTANPFQVGDIIIIKTLDVDGATLNEIYREVMSISGVDVIVGDASTAGSAITWEADTDDTGTISSGDFVIQTGATSNSGSQATRNHYIRWDVASLTTPAMRIFEDVNDSGVSGNEILRLGGMDSYDGSITGDFGISFKSTSGDLFGYITEDELKLAGGHTTGEWTGVQSGAGTTKAFFAGADDIAGTNASFFVQADGHIFSDAASDLVWSRTQLAAFSVDAAASSITDEYWQQNVARSSDGISNDEDIKIRTMRKKRFSKDKMTFTGVGRRESTSGGGSAIVSRTVTIKANISSVSGTETASGSTDIAFSSDTEFSFTVDISGIPDNDLMLIEISVFVEVDISNYDSGTYETDGYLREDVVIETAT